MFKPETHAFSFNTTFQVVKVLVYLFVKVNVKMNVKLLVNETITLQHAINEIC